MNRIDTCLKQLKDCGKKMLSPYITAGCPHPKLTVPIMHALVEAGADILELGIPFSDPMSEGPVIQQAMECALAHHVHSIDVLNMVREFRKNDKDTPVILMTYANPVEQFGYSLFAKEAYESGVDATILVDLPPEEGQEVVRLWQEYQLYSIYLCSPTTSTERLVLINSLAQGYLYYVSLKGVTGADLDINTLKREYQVMKNQTNLPLMVGFGIKTAEMAKTIAGFADGVIVGAALIREMIEAYKANKDVARASFSFIQDMRMAIDNFGTNL